MEKCASKRWVFCTNSQLLCKFYSIKLAMSCLVFRSLAINAKGNLIFCAGCAFTKKLFIDYEAEC